MRNVTFGPLRETCDRIKKVRNSEKILHCNGNGYWGYLNQRLLQQHVAINQIHDIHWDVGN